MIICLEIFEEYWKNGLINIELFTPNFYWYFPIGKLWEKEEAEKKVEISGKPASFYKTKRTWTRVVSMASPFLVSNTQTILAVVSWFWVIAESSPLSCSISARCTTSAPRIPWTPHTIHCQRKIAFIQNLQLVRGIQILMSSSGNSFIQAWRKKAEY